MAQEKQNSIRILQSKPKKQPLAKGIYALLGFIGGAVCSTLVFFTVLNPKQSSDEPMSENLTGVTASNQNETQNPEADPVDKAHVENNQQYKQIKDREFSGLFKHSEQKNATAQNQDSPFDHAFGQPQKPVASKPTVVKPNTTAQTVAIKAPPIAVPLKNAKVTTPTENVETAKEKATEASPEGSVKVSVTQKLKEN